MRQTQCVSTKAFVASRAPEAPRAAPVVCPSPPPFLRPSEYSVALIDSLMGLRRFVHGARVVEIGTGCGVVLAAAAGLEARALCGVDIEEMALRCSEELLRAVGAGDRAELLSGDLWQPVGTRQFDLVLANLPQFPIDGGEVPGRLKTWSDGGPDGRRLLNPFLEELVLHLAPGGRAVITHNAFVGMAATRRTLALHGLSARILRTHLLALPAEKLGQMSAAIRAREAGRALHSIGPHHFAEMHVLEIRSVRRCA